MTVMSKRGIWAGFAALLACACVCAGGFAAADPSQAPVAQYRLDPAAQWQLADAAWSRREYGDAAAMMIAYADANPDAPNAIEALWRAYSVYKTYRPNAERRNAVFEKASKLSGDWVREYGRTDRDRAAKALWALANLYDQEDDRRRAIETLTALEQQFPGSSVEASALFDRGEWMREANQFAGAIDSFRAFQRAAGVCENWDVAAFRIGMCWEQLGDRSRALAAYASALTQAGNDWSWWQLAAGALDAAVRCRALGDDDLCRSLAQTVQEKCPRTAEWGEIQRQAAALLGSAPSQPLHIEARLDEVYSGGMADVDAASLLSVSRTSTVEVQADTGGSGFSGSIRFALGSGTTATSKTAGLKAGADGLSGALSLPGKASDAPPAVFAFALPQTHEHAPDSLSVTRKWIRTGADWGIAVITVKSDARWKLWIDLPNSRTNPANLTDQPDEVVNDGKSFGWIDSADLTAGLTIRIPIEPGPGIREYYPRVRLQRVATRQADLAGSGVEAGCSLPEYAMTVHSPAAFSYRMTFPVAEEAIIAEAIK